MSLLVFSSTSRISQGIIRHFFKSGQFERIVCADLYPNYWGIQRFLKFRETLDGVQSKTQLTDLKINQQSDLHEAVRAATHVVYVTHDYYSNTPSKINLISQTASLVKKLGHVQRFVTVTPVELDHYGESDPIYAANNSENAAKTACPDVIQVKSDLTFGADSDVLTRLQQRIANNQKITFKPVGSSPSPIFVGDLAAITEKVLATAEKGSRFFASGPQKVDWFNIVSVLEKSLGSHYTAQLNKCPIESVISPANTNILSEALYCDSYLNLAQFIAKYHLSVGKDFKDVSELGLKLTEFAEHYKTSPVKAEDLKCKGGCTEVGVQCLLY